MYYAVAAIEDGKIMLENDEQEQLIMLIEQIPFSVAEGDVLLFENDNFTFDETETIKRKEMTQKLLDKLLNRNDE